MGRHTVNISFFRKTLYLCRFKNIYLFIYLRIWLRRVLVAAGGLLICGMCVRDLVP